MILYANEQAKEALLAVCDAALRTGGMSVHKQVTEILLAAGMLYLCLENKKNAESKDDPRIVFLRPPEKPAAPNTAESEESEREK